MRFRARRPVFCVDVGAGVIGRRIMLDDHARPLAARKLVRTVAAYYKDRLANG